MIRSDRISFGTGIDLIKHLLKKRKSIRVHNTAKKVLIPELYSTPRSRTNDYPILAMCLDNVMRSVLSTSYRRLKKEKKHVELQKLEPPDVLVSELLQSLGGERVLQCNPIFQKDSGKPNLEFVIAIPDDIRSRLMTMWLLHELRKQELDAIAKEKAGQSTSKATVGGSPSTAAPSAFKAKTASWMSKAKTVPSKRTAKERPDLLERPGPLTALPMERPRPLTAILEGRVPLMMEPATAIMMGRVPLTTDTPGPSTAMTMERPRPNPSLETMREPRPTAGTDTPLRCGLTILAVGDPISVSVDGDEMEIEEFVSQFVESQMGIQEYVSQFDESPEIGPTHALTHDSDGNLLNVRTFLPRKFIL